jgi:hypothetical protein
VNSPKARLRVEELGSRVLPSASPLTALPGAPALAAGMRIRPAPSPMGGLHGTVTGSLHRSLPTVLDVGRLFAVDGSGRLGGLGTFSVAGSVNGTGFLARGHATGQLTLTNARGSITVSLRGPEQPGFAPLPGRFHFTVTGGTGAYENFHDDGEATLTGQTHGTATTFRLVFV